MKKNSNKKQRFIGRSRHNGHWALLLLACSMVLTSGKLRAERIDVTSQHAGKLQEIIDEAKAGDIINFVDEEYDLEHKNIVIDKALVLKGKSSIGFDPYFKGSSGIRTTLLNAFSIIIASDDVEFKDLKIVQPKPATEDYSVLMDGRTQNYKDNFRRPGKQDGLTYKGIGFDNVELNGGFYSCFAGNGIGATFEHVSFLNFRRIGYINDRRARRGFMPKVTIDYCRFVPDSTDVGFDDRGISFDAGNTEFPIVWGGNGSSVKNSFFRNTGVAFSRIHGIDVTNNTFEDHNGLIDLLHIEEWSYNIVVNGNLFDCRVENPNFRSRIIQLDRELQTVNYIYINNNRIIGDFNFFVSAYCPNNIYINDNDFTGSTATNFVIDFDFYESRGIEPIESKSEFVSFNVDILNNTNIDSANSNFIPDVRMHVPKSGGNIRINGIPKGQQDLQKTDFPTALVSDGVYEIINEETGRKLASNADNNGLITKPKWVGDATVKWEVKFVPPYYYHIKNKDHGGFLEAHKGYTEAEIAQNLPQTEAPFLFAAQSYKPRWSLVGTGKASQFEIFVGGNEKQAALVHDDIAGIKLAFGKAMNDKGLRFPVKFSDNAKWKFVKNSNLRLLQEETLEESVFTLSPNPAMDILTVRYENKEDAIVDLYIYDINGKVMKVEKLFAHAKTSFDISDLKKGLYMVKTSNGHHEKLIVK